MMQLCSICCEFDTDPVEAVRRVVVTKLDGTLEADLFLCRECLSEGLSLDALCSQDSEENK